VIIMAYGHGKSSRQTIIGIGIIVTVALLLLIGSQTPSVETTTVVSDTASPTLPNDGDGTQAVATTSDGVTEIIPREAGHIEELKLDNPLKVDGGLFSYRKDGSVGIIAASFEPDALPVIISDGPSKTGGIEITAISEIRISVKNIGDRPTTVSIWTQFKGNEYPDQIPSQGYEIQPGHSREFQIAISPEIEVQRIGVGQLLL
jgi:hypothetical protein